MANPNPSAARAAKRKQKLNKMGDVDDVRARLWEAVVAASHIVGDETADPALRLRAVHAVTQSSTSYVKLIQASEFEARLVALEEAAD